jgi:hypothetical protein
LLPLLGALLAGPVTALITAIVVEALLSAHERARARRIYQARIVRLGMVATMMSRTLTGHFGPHPTPPSYARASAIYAILADRIECGGRRPALSELRCGGNPEAVGTCASRRLIPSQIT